MLTFSFLIQTFRWLDKTRRNIKAAFQRKINVIPLSVKSTSRKYDFFDGLKHQPENCIVKYFLVGHKF